MFRPEVLALGYPRYMEFLNGEGALPKAFAFTSNPFERQMSGFDGGSNYTGVSCWLKLAEGADINEAIGTCAAWRQVHLAFYEKSARLFYVPDMNCEKKIVILFDKEEKLPDLTMETIEICKNAEIRLAFVKSEYILYDIVDQKEYELRFTEYPGSADDAATYADWYLY